ncbi:MAG: hypothetical protein PHT12_03075 [Patescibacteria group bacterium]|nr:hypothetical protein [Patescibacteria group bacterium]
MRAFERRQKRTTIEGGGHRSAALFGLLVVVALLAYAVIIGKLTSTEDRLIAFVPGHAAVYLHERNGDSSQSPLLDPLNTGAVEKSRFAVLDAEKRLSWASLVRLGKNSARAKEALKQNGAVKLSKDVYAYGDAVAMNALTEAAGRAPSLAERETAAKALANLNAIMPMQIYATPAAMSAMSSDPTNALPVSEAVVGGTNKAGKLARLLTENAAAAGISSAQAKNARAARTQGQPIWSADLRPGIINPLSMVDDGSRANNLVGGKEAADALFRSLNQPLQASLWLRDGSLGYQLKFSSPRTAALADAWLDYLNATQHSTTSLSLPDGDIATEIRRKNRYSFTDDGGWLKLSDLENQSANLNFWLKKEKDGLIVTNSRNSGTTPETQPPDIACPIINDDWLKLDKNLSKNLRAKVPVLLFVTSPEAASMVIYRIGDNNIMICG